MSSSNKNSRVISGIEVNITTDVPANLNSADTLASGIALVNATDDDNTTNYRIYLETSSGYSQVDTITMLESTAPYGLNYTVEADDWTDYCTGASYTWAECGETFGECTDGVTECCGDDDNENKDL